MHLNYVNIRHLKSFLNLVNGLFFFFIVRLSVNPVFATLFPNSLSPVGFGSCHY